MNKRVLTVALIAVLGTMAVGCQKETIVDLQGSAAETATVYTVQYAIDGVLHTEVLHGEEEYNAVLSRLMAMARSGSKVELFAQNTSQREQASKKTETFTTDSEAEATSWSKKKMDEGYNVVVTFDEKEKVYICIAYM